MTVKIAHRNNPVDIDSYTFGVYMLFCALDVFSMSPSLTRVAACRKGLIGKLKYCANTDADEDTDADMDADRC